MRVYTSVGCPLTQGHVLGPCMKRMFVCSVSTFRIMVVFMCIAYIHVHQLKTDNKTNIIRLSTVLRLVTEILFLAVLTITYMWSLFVQEKPVKLV